MYGATRAVAWFTGLYMAFTALIWIAMLRANKKTQAALEETRRSNALTERSLRLAHRPVLHVIGFKWEDYASGAPQRFISFGLRNIGTDAARDLRVVRDFFYGPLDGALAMVKDWRPTLRYGSLGHDLERPYRAGIEPAAYARDNLRYVVVAEYTDTFDDAWRYTAVYEWRRGIPAWEEEFGALDPADSR